MKAAIVMLVAAAAIFWATQYYMKEGANVYVPTCDNAIVYTDLVQANNNKDNVCILDLSSQHLSHLPEDLLSFFSLQALYLNDNELVTLPEWIVSLKSLKTLDLTDSQINDFDINKLRSRMSHTTILNLKRMESPEE